MSMKINVSESQMDETTFKQAVDTFLDYAPEGGWNDYWEMQQDWAMFTDGLVRDGTVTDRQAGNWSNPCTPETFDSWQKRNGLTRRSRAWDETKKSETDDDKGCKGKDCKDDKTKKNEADATFKVGDFVNYDAESDGKDVDDSFIPCEVVDVNDDGTLGLCVYGSYADEEELGENASASCCSKLDHYAGMVDANHYYMGGKYNAYKGGWEILITNKELNPKVYEFIGTIDDLSEVLDIDDFYGDENFVFDEDLKDEVANNTGWDVETTTFADMTGDVGESKQTEAKKSEATKFGAGMATRKDFSKTKNLGEIFDVLDEHLKSLKAASEDMSKSKEDLEASIKKLQEFEGYTDFLKQQSVKGIKKALTLKNSPEVQAASEIEKNLKDALSVIMSDYKNVADVTQLMVVIDSKYATRGSQILTTLEGQVSRAIDVDMKTIKDSIESGDITEDDVMKLVTMTSVSKGMKNKDTATKVKPVLERMNAMLESASKVEEAIIDPKQFKELRDLVEQIVNEASTPKETIKTTVTALDKDTISTVPEAKDGGLLGKLKEFVNAIKDKIAGLWDSFTSLFFSIEDDALEASDVFDEVEAELGEEGISIDAGKKATETLSKQFEVLTKSVLTCCDNLVKDAALAGEFDDEVIYAEEAVKNAVESFQNLGEACKSLKDSLSCHKNEDNMNVIGILADAITQIVADEEGVIEDEETADAEDDSNSVIDDVERRYSAPGGEQEEPEMGNEEPELGGEEEPEEF